MSGGLTVNTGGAKVSGGITIFNGGDTVSGGSFITGGLTLYDIGASMSGGLTVNTGGAKVSGGLTVLDKGVWVSGGLTVSGGNAFAPSFVSTSDRRLKTSIIPINNALHKISKLNGVYFKWIKNEPNGLVFDDRRHVGVLAQEVQQVLPEGVHSKDNYLAVEYTSLIPLLIEAIHELEVITAKDNSIGNEEDANILHMVTQMKDDFILLQQMMKLRDEELNSIKKSLELKDEELQMLRSWKSIMEDRLKSLERVVFVPL
mmetsp:Transcript_19736/g.28188  ORF Transcript_19736/g.28188 Transcript_19736/m.28188 type:complete len:259 (-) Transcript_19736:73-849(-)